MIYESKNFYCREFKTSNEEFEVLRNIAISDESNKNYYDFIPERLILENHISYNVTFEKQTNKPAVMNGLIEIQSGVGRMMNRHYIFPEFRNKTFRQLVSALEVVNEYMVKPLYEISPFDAHVLTMPNRNDTENASFWKAFTKAHFRAWPGHWHEVDGYILTGANPDLKRCWQNALTDNRSYKFETISHDDWLKLQ